MDARGITDWVLWADKTITFPTDRRPDNALVGSWTADKSADQPRSFSTCRWCRSDHSRDTGYSVARPSADVTPTRRARGLRDKPPDPHQLTTSQYQSAQEWHTTSSGGRDATGWPPKRA